jgi:hypothetical protein
MKRLALAVVLPLIAVAAGTQIGCSTTKAMVSSESVPASQGTVKVSEGDNGGTKIDINVKHLAPPAKVAADAKVYVVWIQPRNSPQQSLGTMTLNDNLEGRLEATTPHRNFLVNVTPEPSGQVVAPTHEPVFTSDVAR